MELSNNDFFNLVLNSQIDHKNIKVRHARKDVIKFLKETNLDISPSKLIRIFREREGSIKGYDSERKLLSEIITELQRDSRINKMLE